MIQEPSLLPHFYAIVLTTRVVNPNPNPKSGIRQSEEFRINLWPLIRIRNPRKFGLINPKNPN
jgi:hypothetical protein